MKINQYGKSSNGLLNLKTSFFEDNEKHLKKQREIASVYTKQPLRKKCKNCDQSLSLNHDPDIFKDGIGYYICDNCSHLNGMYEDTTAFCEAVYTSDDGEKKYAENYSVERLNDYNYRTTSIYLPKAEFLITTLKSNGIDPYNEEYLDFGTGTGFFVSALKRTGIKQVKGTEVSNTQVELGNRMIGEDLLSVHNLDETNNILRNTTARVVSMIGVLEHLQHPRQALKEIQENDDIEFLFISVPTFSLSVYLELLSPDVFHRQLSGGHTHNYTEESLNYLADEFDFKIIGEWWFGSDMVDLFRHLKVNMHHQNASDKAINRFSSEFRPIIDALQMEIDKKHYSCQVHMIFQKK